MRNITEKLAKKFNGIDINVIEEILKIGRIEGYLDGIVEGYLKGSIEEQSEERFKGQFKECVKIDNVPQWYKEFMERK